MAKIVFDDVKFMKTPLNDGGPVWSEQESCGCIKGNFLYCSESNDLKISEESSWNSVYYKLYFDNLGDNSDGNTHKPTLDLFKEAHPHVFNLLNRAEFMLCKRKKLNTSLFRERLKKLVLGRLRKMDEVVFLSDSPGDLEKYLVDNKEVLVNV